MAQANLIVDPVVPDLPPEAGGRPIWARLARGGMAEVFLAGGEDQAVAIKRARRDRPDRDRLDALLVAEARLTACLRHPNIVRVIDDGRDDEGPYLVLEYVEGLDLHALLAACSRRRLALPLALRLAIVCSVLRALEYAHRARDERGAPFEVVHRDISPANVLVGFDGAVKLCDFGIASATVMPSPEDSIDGKASYMSPEHARGEAIDQRADLYACGILLWEVLSGRRMRRRDEDRLAAAQRGEVPPLVVLGLPEEARLHAIAHRALAPEPAERYETAGEMMRDLERWCRLNGLLAGESEIGRFLREHFAERRAELVALRTEPPMGEIRGADCTPTHSTARPRRRLAKTTPVVDRGWLAATPYLVASAAITLAALTGLAKLGLF